MLNADLQAILDEINEHECKDPHYQIGVAMQMVVTARAERDYWKELCREYRDERDHAEERLLNGGVK